LNRAVHFAAALLLLSLVACGSTSAEEHSKKGVKLAAEGKPQEAIAEFEKAMGKDANYAPAYSERGRARLSLGALELAIDDFARAIELDSSLESPLAPARADAYSRQGGQFLEAGDIAMATLAYERAVAAHPEGSSLLRLPLAQAYKTRGDDLRDAEDYAKAVDTYETAISLDPGQEAILTPTGKITFTSQSSGGSQRIQQIAADGSAITFLVNGSNPKWLDAGGRLAFSFGSIFILEADGAVRNLTAAAGRTGGYLDWSPDGSKIVFASIPQGGDFYAYDLFVINTDGSGLARLTQGSGADISPAWSPDGSRIVFESVPQGLYVMDPSSSIPTSLGSGSCPDWSPQGTKIAFSRGGIWTMNADGTGAVEIVTVPEAINICPKWSPDGLHLAFSSTKLGENLHDVYIVQANGKKLRKLTDLPATSDFVAQWTR